MTGLRGQPEKGALGAGGEFVVILEGGLPPDGIRPKSEFWTTMSPASAVATLPSGQGGRPPEAGPSPSGASPGRTHGWEPTHGDGVPGIYIGLAPQRPPP